MLIVFGRLPKGKRRMLKATVMREINVPAYTRHDGTYVPQHRKMVRVNLDRSNSDIVAGRGSVVQREAHARVTRMIQGFASLSQDQQVAHILSHAHDLQDARNHARDLSGWRQNAGAGRNPTAGQWVAFSRLDADRKAAEIARVVESHGSTAHLRDPGQDVPAAAVQTQPAPASAPAPASQAVAIAESLTTGPVEVTPESLRLVMASAMRVVQFPADVAGWSDSPTNQQCRRRLRQLQELAADGDLDAITNFSTSRTRANYSLVAEYRDLLMEAAHEARQARATAQPSPPAAPVASAAPAATSPAPASAIPEPPAITGANPRNTALIAAQRKVQALRAAAQADDPVAAILAIPTSRGNGYMNRADDYKTALLAHFGHTVAGAPAHEHARPSGRRREPLAPQAAAAPAPRPPDASGSSPDQDPVYAANMLRQTEQQLGFVPRPNIPLEWTVQRNGIRLSSGELVPWPDEKFKSLAQRYLGQPSQAQLRAKNHQQANKAELVALMHPAISAKFRQVTEAARVAQETVRAEQARAAQRRAQETRGAASAFLEELQALPDLHRPRAQVGANVRQLTGNIEAVAGVLNVDPGKLSEMVKSMVADYGAGEVFDIRVSVRSRESVSVDFTGDGGTYIARKFSWESGGLAVDHSFFRAGSRGNGSAKALFRVSLGVYKTLGVKKVKVHANIDVGGYAWAKFGFVPNASSWERLRGRMSEKLMRLPGVSSDAKDRIRALLAKNDPKTLFALSDAKIGERSIGKEMLLGSDWYGVLSLNDGESYRRCIGYISQGRG